MKGFYKLFVAQVKEKLRNKAALFMIFGFPIMLIIVFGLIFGGEAGDNYNFNIGLIKGEGRIYEQVKEEIKTNNAFMLSSGSSEKELAALKEGERNLVLDLSNLNYQQLKAEKNQKVKIYYDSTNMVMNENLINSFQKVFVDLEDQILGRERNIQVLSESVQAKEGLGHFQFMMPGVLALVVMQLGLFGCYDYLNLREKKIIRSLGATPLSRFTLLSSELAVRLVMGLLQTLVLISVSYFLYDLTIVGNWLLLLGAVVLGNLFFTSLGYMLICFVSSIETASALIQLVQFPMIFLSGIFFPIGMLPDFIKPVVKILPLTYLGDLLRQIMLGTSGQYSIGFNYLVLSTWLVFTVLITVKFWRWE